MKNRTKNWSLCKSTFHLREKEREGERRSGLSHLQEDYVMPKLQIIAAMYVVYECVCECVCYGAYAQCPQTQKVTMTIIGEGSYVSNSSKKNLIMILVWGFLSVMVLCGRFANESFLVVGLYFFSKLGQIFNRLFERFMRFERKRLKMKMICNKLKYE